MHYEYGITITTVSGAYYKSADKFESELCAKNFIKKLDSIFFLEMEQNRCIRFSEHTIETIQIVRYTVCGD